VRHWVGAAKVNRSTAETMLATANVERTFGQVGILETPIVTIALGFPFAVARTFGTAEDGAKTASTSTGGITNHAS
jgi:hypothetical protein